jgi:excinuclease UvrABC ATPase subunit
VPETLPTVIGVHGARHNNLRDVNVDVPLWRTVAVVGVSGSGKTSLAIGTLYAEGMHRFLEGLSTYSRRRLTQAQRPDVDRIDHLPPALALRQRPPIPGPRSTVGTMSEVLNVLRLMMSRLGSHLCPNGHRVEPSIETQRMVITCPVDGVQFDAPSAESFAFNSYGACPACHGLGVRSEVNEAALVPDPDLSISGGAVLPWNAGARRLYQYAARELGVRLDVPWKDLTDSERDIVLHGEPVQRRVRFRSGRRNREVELNVTYENAIATAERNLDSDSQQARRQVGRYFDTRTCSVCHGTRLRPEALTSLLGGKNIAEISALRLDELRDFAVGLHPSNVQGLRRAVGALAANGNSVVVVEHEGEIIRTKEGQCPTCRGLGGIDLDVQYLPDITVECPTCHGARFNDATLAVKFDGLTIADVLGLTVHEALDRFADQGPVAAALRPVDEVGLGYLRLGEPTPSLSGGESQRLRIASRLRSSQRGALYVFDEPSTGLHPLDVDTLVTVFDRLLEAGATIIVIDHDLDLIGAADLLIDMGPGGGPDGGHILAVGAPEDVARDPASVTGPWLAEHLGLGPPKRG